MDIQALTRILDRVGRGASTSTDADALRAILQPYLCPAVPSREEARHSDSFNPRVGSQATVALTFVRDRYPRGEFLIRTTYRLPDGSVSADEGRRIRLSADYAPLIHELWDVGFDEVARALQNGPAVVRLAVACANLEAFWSETVRTVAIIIGYELNIVVTGTAPVQQKIPTKREAGQS